MKWQCGITLLLVGLATAGPVAAADALELDGATIIGNRELPKALDVAQQEIEADLEFAARFVDNGGRLRSKDHVDGDPRRHYHWQERSDGQRDRELVPKPKPRERPPSSSH